MSSTKASAVLLASTLMPDCFCCATRWPVMSNTSASTVASAMRADVVLMTFTLFVRQFHCTCCGVQASFAPQ